MQEASSLRALGIPQIQNHVPSRFPALSVPVNCMQDDIKTPIKLIKHNKLYVKSLKKLDANP